MSNIAFSPVHYGDIIANNRLVMAPMTRCRATEDGSATAIMATYYSQRASAGLIISEGIYPSNLGKGFIATPGLHSEDQVRSWQPVTEAVHKRDGKIFAQLMHAGRIGHSSINGEEPIAPSAIAANGEHLTADGMQPFPVPRAMTEQDIKQAIQDHVQAAINAIDAGFDGIEIHAGNGFLIHQFLASNTNKRQDAYGGSISARTRFALEVIEGCGNAIGFGKVGVRISPHNNYNDIIELDSGDLYADLVSKLPRNLAYLHIMEANCRTQTEIIRAHWQSALIVNPHSDENAWPASANMLDIVLNSGLADGVCFGDLFISNPDLVERIQQRAPLNKVQSEFLYSGDEKGYIDYPVLEQEPETI